MLFELLAFWLIIRFMKLYCFARRTVSNLIIDKYKDI